MLYTLYDYRDCLSSNPNEGNFKYPIRTIEIMNLEKECRLVFPPDPLAEIPSDSLACT